MRRSKLKVPNARQGPGTGEKKGGDMYVCICFAFQKLWKAMYTKIAKLVGLNSTWPHLRGAGS